eukprot:690122-Ditylum_brightwellii.AAC.1
MTEDNVIAAPKESSFDGRFGCVCGNICVNVMQPKSSSLVTPTAALCQCTDCYQFALAVSKFRKEFCPESSEEADALTASNATNMRQIYKSDAVKLSGEDYLQGVKLKQDSPCIRYYSKCCGTPILIDYTMSPFFLVFQHTMNATKKDGRFQRMKPTVVLNHNSAPPKSPSTPDDIPVQDGVSIGFMFHIIARVLWGILSGKKSSPITTKLETVPTHIGINSLGKKEETEK